MVYESIIVEMEETTKEGVLEEGKVLQEPLLKEDEEEHKCRDKALYQSPPK